MLALLFSVTGCSHVSYLVQAGLGQFALYNHERPIEEVLTDPHTPEKVRERLQWIPEIKKLVESELGIKATSNYTTYVHLDRPYVIWSLTAAEPFDVKLKQWSFPFFGSFPYLGFFKKDTAENWRSDYEREGYDTYVRGVGAYSTLGYLRDPMLSSMLYRNKADMVNLIYHESTHGQIYIKGQVAFNEQIASYIGDYGEKQWLARTYGENSPEHKRWFDDREDRREFGRMLRKFNDELKAFYASTVEKPESERKAGKAERFARFQKLLETHKWKGQGMGRASKLITNNAALLAFLTYEDEQEIFDSLDQKCKGRLKDALAFLKEFEKEWDKLRESDPKATPQALLKQRLAATSSLDAGRAVCLNAHVE